MTKTDTKVKPGYHLWEAVGKPVAIYLSLDVVDRMLQDVMRGFGAVPKRGAEVGGILIGRITPGDRLTVEVEDYELIPIEYRRGPSYLLSDADRKAFAETYGRLRNGVQNGTEPVGMFRSHTRDAVGLGSEDLELIDNYFPEADKIFLMIRPYATRVSTAGFYFRENGAFQIGPPLEEFPFRRKELTLEDGAPAPARSSEPSSLHRILPLVSEPKIREDVPRPAPVLRQELVPFRPPDPPPAAAKAAALPDVETKPQERSGWVWLPMSFIFLLLGVLLGFQAALTLRPQAPTTDPFNLSLSVSKEGDNLSVRWDRQAAAIRAARQGVLVIEDGTYNKTVDLDPGQLQTGSVVYRHSSNDVKFRLELFLRDRDTIFEKVEWKQ